MRRGPSPRCPYVRCTPGQPRQRCTLKAHSGDVAHVLAPTGTRGRPAKPEGPRVPLRISLSPTARGEIVKLAGADSTPAISALMERTFAPSATGGKRSRKNAPPRTRQTRKNATQTKRLVS